MIDKKTVDRLFLQFGVDDINQLSIREVGKLVSKIEEESGVEFIHMEMGVPGLSPSTIGVQAEKEALDKGLAQFYPHIEGIPEAKDEIARFAQLSMGINVSDLNCIPTVGGMQASFAALLSVARTNAEKPYTLFIDPGFPVQKSQLQLMGLPYLSFDFFNCRGEKMKSKLEEYLAKGNICSICYSSPNNPTWCSFTEEELKIIGELAAKYDAIVIEDLAYFGMDFRKDYSVKSDKDTQVYHPTIAKFTDNYILLLSASKIFSYAGQRIAMMIISEKLRKRKYPNLKNYFTSDTLGDFIPYGVLYATTAGTSHTAQYALAQILKSVNDVKQDYLKPLKSYGEKAKLLKRIFQKYGFYLIYNDVEQDLADGFYFTIAYPGLSSGELMKAFLYVGISAISLSITGSENLNGLRACVSFVRFDQMDELDKRLNFLTKKLIKPV